MIAGIGLINFRLGEALERYKITGASLAKELGVSQTSISEWRQGNAKPSLDRLDQIMKALHDLADAEQLEIFPLSLSDLLYWTPDV